MVKPKLIHGTFLHTINNKLEILENQFMIIEEGKIKSISLNKPEGDFEFYETTKTQIIIPGLIDTHIHAPQYVFAGCGLDLPLLEWLKKYTFPAETKFQDVEHAKKVYEAVVSNTLSHGTTTASYYATIWTESSLLLADICRKQGQRAFVGKVSMDRNSPPTYVEETSKSIESASNFVNSFKNLDDIVQPIITPRFVPTCTGELMKGLSEIQNKRPSTLIQSHVSENIGEIEWVKSLHPDLPNYCGVYKEFGLLGPNTILAHGVHLTDDEIKMLNETGASIAHCPSSNFQLFSGVCDIRKLQKNGVKVGLGTDVAGGPSPSMIDAMRNALICSRSLLFMKRDKNEEYIPLTVPDVLALATESGAKALNIDNKVGNFLIGKEFDAIIADLNIGACHCFGEESILDLLDKFVHRGDDRNVIHVFVQGNIVK